MSSSTPVTEASMLPDLAELLGLIDELSTRLIIDGVATLTPDGLHALAAGSSLPEFQAAARKLAMLLDLGAGNAPDEFAAEIGAGLEQLRKLLERAISEPTESETSQVYAASQAQAAFETLPIPDSPVSLAEDQELVLEFITESNEHLVNIEGHMLALEKDRHDAEILNAVFRAFHTIKGLAGFLEFGAIQALAHEVETLLDLARNNKLEVTPPVVDLILESTDIVRRELSGIQQRLAGNPPEASAVDKALLQRIRSASHWQAQPESESTAAASLAQKELVLAPDAAARLSDQPSPAVPVNAIAPLHTESGFNDITSATDAKHAAVAGTENNVLTPETSASGTASASQPASARGPENGPAVAKVAASASAIKPADGGSVRIDTAKLDQLMDLVGEMVIAQTLIGHSPALTSVTDARLLSDLTQLARITADVQRITTGMRMVPIGLQFQKTARVVRDLSRRAGKQVVLECIGEDTEVDKTIAEELSDPLLHMVRNSIDHGIETPDERVAAGKDPLAHVRLAAYHQSGQIVISISDDGRGLNRERIFNKAVERGLIHAGASLTENEIFLLIFEAGFSTAEKVTDISGRGVGMDVVRRHVQALRGRIDVQSRPGEGTTFFLKLPLTLAIIEGLIVMVGDQRYVVPIFSVREMFRPSTKMLSTVQGKKELALVRGSLLPIIRLHQRFEKTPRTTELSDGTLIVVEAEGHSFCLFVDDVIGKQEVVIKGLGPTFEHVVGIAGCAILGDGRVGLILEMVGIFKGRQR